MSDFMPLNDTKDVSFINVGLIEKIAQEMVQGKTIVTFVSKEQLVLGRNDSVELLRRINTARGANAA